LIDLHEGLGKPPPDEIVNRPVLSESAAYIWDAFYIISETRQAGFGGMQRLRLCDIRDYIALFGKPHDVEAFVELILFLDGEYVSEAMKRVKK